MSSFTGASEKRMKQGSGNGVSVSYGKSARGNWRTGSFTGCPEEYIKEGSANGLSLSLWDHGEAAAFTGDFERNARRLYREILFIRDSEKYVNEGSGKGQL